jgi:hypothetical protein
MVEFSNKFGGQLEKYTNSLAYTDRKIVGSFIGMGVCGVVGFFAFSSNIAIGVGGGTLTYILNSLNN